MSLTKKDKYIKIESGFIDLLNDTGTVATGGPLPYGTTQPGAQFGTSAATTIVLNSNTNGNMRNFLHLSFDPVYDKIILTTGEGLGHAGHTTIPDSSWTLTTADGGTSTVEGNLQFANLWGNMVIDPDSLNPVTTDGVDGFVTAFPFWYSGTATYHSYDFNTGTLYASYQYRYKEVNRGGEGKFDIDYGNTNMVEFDTSKWNYSGGYHGITFPIDKDTPWTQVFGASTGRDDPWPNGQPTHPDEEQWWWWSGQALIPEALGRLVVNRYYAWAANFAAFFKPDLARYFARPVVLDDVVVTIVGEPNFGAMLSVIDRDTLEWRGSRPLELSYPLDILPMGHDRFMVIALPGSNSLGNQWLRNGQGNELMSLEYRYNRNQNSLELDRVTKIPTEEAYSWPLHIGQFAYDSNRGQLLMLNAEQNTIERHVDSQLCHPPRPTNIEEPSPITPLQAGRNLTMAALTRSDLEPLGSPDTKITFGDINTDLFVLQPNVMKTLTTTGIGYFNLALTSAACGVDLPLNTHLSAYSVVASTTNEYGIAYGVDPMALISVSAVFPLSNALSAANTLTTLTTNTTILAKGLGTAGDSIGEGTARELAYPVDGVVTTPLVYTRNPVQWTNMWDQALVRPIYASRRTLSKTVTAQFDDDVTDLEIQEIWLGGGNRVSMEFSFFSLLWDYLRNPPDVATQGYVQWSPKDVSTKVYNVLITNLEVGGNNQVKFDNLAKAGDGWIHENVVLTIRIISEV